MRSLVVVAFMAATAFGQQPRIEGITPSEGPIAGGTVVTIRGASLGGATIRVDRTAVTPLSQTTTEVRVAMPAHDNGYGVISARSIAGAAYAEYLYLPPRLDELPAGSITTVAGAGNFSRDYGDAKQATFVETWGVTLDGDGNIYVGDAPGGRVDRITPAGVIERLAGGVSSLDVRDGVPAVDAPLAYPRTVAFDDAGNAYIGSNACRLQKIDAATGIITTFAGTGTCGYSGDGGPASLAQIGSPTWLAADHDDLYFIDFAYVAQPPVTRDSVRIRKIHFADGRISTIAGNGTVGDAGDGGPATAASFDFGGGGVDAGNIALDPGGNIYIADSGNGRIRRIDRTTGIITTFYRPGHGTPDDVGVQALAVDRQGNVYYGASGRIAKVSPSGAFLTTYGNGTYALPVEGSPVASTGLGFVHGIAVDASGNILYTDNAVARVRRINIATGTVETIAGMGPAKVGENGPALAAVIGTLNDIAFDAGGNLILGETLRLRKLDRSGNLLTIGGTGSFVGRLPPAPANQVVIAAAGVVAGRDGTIDATNFSVINRIDGAGNLRWIVGHSADCALSGDGGPATQATLCQAWDSARDAAGNLYIADTNNNRIRRVDAKTNVITTIAGNGGPVNGTERYGFGTYCGDGGKAFDACLNTPYGIAVDADGSIFFSENWQRIRRIDPNGTIGTFVRSSAASKVRFGPGGFLYADDFNRIGRYDRKGNFTLIAGTGEEGFSGDGGPALLARVSTKSQAAGIAIDDAGNLYFTDGNRVRAVRYGAVLAPANASVEATANGTLLHATVRDRSGTPAPGVRVNFRAPASGASCLLSSPFAITDANGIAAVSCTPNCVAGAYAATAQTVNGGATATVPLTNGGGPCRRRVVRH